MELSALTDSVNQCFAEQEQTAATAALLSRKIIRKTKNAIHSIHVDARNGALFAALPSDLAELTAAVQKYPPVRYSAAVQNAMMEVTEAVLFDRTVRGEPLPSYLELGVTPTAWVMGLGDSIGELRRVLLKDLMAGDTADARRIFSAMDSMADALLSFDVPDGIAPIRRKQDIARGVIEKSRTDLTNALIAARIKV
ncbi:MAG: RNA-binding protein [Candidatus Methanomethylophilus sp.]|nr:RNA-binding protein [Methanomethylophilus sp.]MDD4668229.1 RNA-binding protein [Methanomethylophilus sp.]